MFKEFLIVIYDYFSISRKYLFFDVGIPMTTVLIIFIFNFNCLTLNDSLLGQQITLLGIIAGFNITSLSVLTTASNSMIDTLKAKFGENRISGKKINLFQELYIFISYSVMISFIVIFFCFIGYVLPIKEITVNIFYNFLAYSNLVLAFHIFFLNVRNISMIYFSFFNSK